MKKALPFAIAILFVCPVFFPTSANANDGGKSNGSSPSVLHQNHGKSWIDKAWDDLMNLFRSHHDPKGPTTPNHGNDGSGSNGNNNGNGNGGNGNHNGWGTPGSGTPGDGGSGATGGNGGSSPSAPLDGGLSLLMIAGVGLGVKKTFGKKKTAAPKSEA
jgi:hypothetical protein